MVLIKQLKNTGLQVEQITHNVMKKYVRFIISSCLLYVVDATAICCLGSFAKAAKMEILNVKTFSTGEAAMSKYNRCRYSTK